MAITEKKKKKKKSKKTSDRAIWDRYIPGYGKGSPVVGVGLMGVSPGGTAGESVDRWGIPLSVTTTTEAYLDKDQDVIPTKRRVAKTADSWAAAHPTKSKPTTRIQFEIPKNNKRK